MVTITDSKKIFQELIEKSKESYLCGDMGNDILLPDSKTFVLTDSTKDEPQETRWFLLDPDVKPIFRRNPLRIKSCVFNEKTKTYDIVYEVDINLHGAVTSKGDGS